ncbi:MULTISPECIES: DUF6080 domain-containing protein [Prevotellaceae]|uniref:DUF6080 domain-containing protein n=1 Tax=Prevotellaceae TaxID=171552 RepID=UPI0004122CF5|nr:DUF6080 domain-containing protein [Prevotella phocaeensis]
MKMRNIFRIRREEALPSLVAMVVFIALNALLAYKYFGLFTRAKNVGFWSLFFKNFHVSGYDAYSYIELSNAASYYETTRHPLLYSLLYPFYLFNDFLMAQYGVNFAMFLMMALLVMCAFYTFVFLFRTFREVIELSLTDSLILCVLFFSFAHIMLTVLVPDHFGLSLFLLSTTLYLTGCYLKQQKVFRWWQTALLFTLTAGVTLTNGLKTLLAAWFVNGRRVFSLRFVLPVVAVPLILLFAVERYQYREIVIPQNEKSRQIGEDKAKTDAAFRAETARHNVWVEQHNGKGLDSEVPLLQWMDLSTSRIETVVENLFGESLQLHQDHLLEDVQISRPIFVPYRHPFRYAVEALVVLLFVAGLWCGRREKLLLLCLSWFAVDMIMHIGFGFAINEVYIMAANWLFIVPLSVAYLLKQLPVHYACGLRVLLVCLAVYLWIYNGGLLVGYMIR